MLTFLSDVKWTGGRVAARSRSPRVRCKIDVYFDVNTNIVYAIVRLLRCSVAEGDCVVVVFLLDASVHFTCSDFADSSLTGGCAINYVFG